MNEENKEMVNPLDYVYSPDQVIAINANALLSVMSFLDQVIEKEPNVGALLVYPKNVKELKDEKDNLLKVDIQWEEHNADSFFFTALDVNGGVPILTEIALKATQLLHGFTKIHEQNINNGIAKKQEDLNAERAFEPQPLPKSN